METVEEIVGQLRADVSVDVVGMRASGRSTVLRRAVEQLAADGATVVSIAGVGGLRDRSLGALAVAGLDFAVSPNSLQMLASAVAALEARLSDGPSVLAIDDADDLDPATLGAVAAVTARLRVPVIATSRLGRRGADLGALVSALQPGVRVTLQPLRFDEVHRLVHELLGGPVDPTAVARVAALSGGLPGLVSAVVATARRASRLAPRGGRWVVRGDLWTTALAHAVEPLLAGLDEPCLDAVTTVALAGPQSLEATRRVVPPASLVLLDDMGLLRMVPHGLEAVVAVYPPVLADYVAHEGSAARGLLTGERLAEAGRDASPDRPAAGGGLAVPERRRVPGADAIVSDRLTRHWQEQVRTRTRAWEAAPTPDGAVALVEALLTARAPRHQVDAAAARAHAAGASGRERAALLAWSALDAGAGRDDLQAARALLGDDEAEPALDGMLRATGAYLDLLACAVPGADALADPPAGSDALARDAVRLVRAESLVAAGRARAALALLDGFAPDVAVLAQRADAVRELASLYMCDLDGAVASATARVEGCKLALDPVGAAAHAYAACLGLSFQGRLIELDDLVSSVLSLAPMPEYLTHLQVGLLTLAADAARWQGRAAYARQVAHQANALTSRRGPHPGMTATALFAQLPEVDDGTAADELWAIADERLAHGYLPAGIVAGVAAVERRPDAARAQRLADAARQCDCPLPVHLATYAAAIASDDPAQLAELEPRLLAAGLRLYAVRTAVARSMSMLACGDTVGAASHADAAWNQAGLRGRDLCGLFRRFDHALSLTAREREIAVLVARGLSSQEIADRKVLSVRTVENHIFSACRKVGVNNREALARAAQTWLSCAVD